MKTESIFQTFIKYVSANILGMIGLSCYILADTVFVARGVGPDGLTGLNLAIPVYNFLNGVGLMIGMGGATRYSIAKGSQDTKTRETIFTKALFLLIICSSVFFIAGLFLPERIALLLGADAVILPLTTSYTRIMLLFAPMFMLNSLLICFVRNDGKPRLAMAAMLFGSFSNIILDYIFIFPFGWGITGAALATGAAPIISMCLLSIHFIRKENNFHLRLTKLGFKHIKDISLLGVSSLIVEVSSGVVIIVFNMLILKDSGNVGVAAYGILANIALVLVAIFTGISQGIQPLLSHCYGKKENQNVQRVLRYALVCGLIFALLSYGSTFLFANSITDIFNKDQDPTLHAIAVTGMRIYFTAFLFAGVNIISASYFSAIDQPKKAFLLSCLRGFILVIPMAFLMSYLFGLTGIWMTMPVAECLVMLLAIFFLKRTRR